MIFFLLSDKRSIVHFCDIGGWVHTIGHSRVIGLNILKLQPIQLLEAVVSF